MATRPLRQSSRCCARGREGCPLIRHCLRSERIHESLAPLPFRPASCACRSPMLFRVRAGPINSARSSVHCLFGLGEDPAHFEAHRRAAGRGRGLCAAASSNEVEPTMTASESDGREGGTILRVVGGATARGRGRERVVVRARCVGTGGQTMQGPRKGPAFGHAISPSLWPLGRWWRAVSTVA